MKISDFEKFIREISFEYQSFDMLPESVRDGLKKNSPLC